MLSDECSVLLIDDDADVLDAYTLLLEQAGYRVRACNNPVDARNWMPVDWPGIVLSDVCMPGCSGIDLMTLLHQNDNQLPILLITGHGDVPMAQSVLDQRQQFAGIDWFLQEIPCPLLHRLHRHRHIAMPGDQQDRQLIVILVE